MNAKDRYLFESLIYKGYSKEQAKLLVNVRPKDFRQETGTTKGYFRKLKKQRDNYQKATKAGIEPKRAKDISTRSRKHVNETSKSLYEDRKEVYKKHRKEIAKPKTEYSQVVEIQRRKEWSNFSKTKKNGGNGFNAKEMNLVKSINGMLGRNEFDRYGFKIVFDNYVTGKSIKSLLLQFRASDNKEDFYENIEDLINPNAGKLWKARIEKLLSREDFILAKRTFESNPKIGRPSKKAVSKTKKMINGGY